MAKSIHTFHIPVMGIGFTIDSPLKVAQYGVDSVISLVDDILIEKLRKMYSEKFEIPYQEISNKVDDFRAKRITSYLNLINELVDTKFEALKKSALEKSDEFRAYLDMLPSSSTLSAEFKKLTDTGAAITDIKTWINQNLIKGSIDVNIMTKVNKDNFNKQKEQLPTKYNDAHAALRGFADSNLNGSVVLSAGMNPRLYSYMAEFNDFYPTANGSFKKRIILKVSDYRSALIQGKFLAKRGLWVSEYRIESGLNCGGHAFATDGYLLGPVLAEFKHKREALHAAIETILRQELQNQNRILPNQPLPLKISAQGGVGTYNEHEFLLNEYELDSIGWGSPFLLVPQATTVDSKTMNQLAKAKENDLYLSDISPLGVPFNNLKNNTKDQEKEAYIKKGRPGSACPKKFVALNKDYKQTGMCTASREYQHIKIKELQAEQLPEVEYQAKFNKIVEKSCTCVGLGTSALLNYGLDTKTEGKGVSICPGPNMAYYNKIVSLNTMVNHVYGRTNIISRLDRPHVFVKELDVYIGFLKNKFNDVKNIMTKKDVKYFDTFIKNMQEGIAYYQSLFSKHQDKFPDVKHDILNAIKGGEMEIKSIAVELEKYLNTITKSSVTAT